MKKLLLLLTFLGLIIAGCSDSSNNPVSIKPSQKNLIPLPEKSSLSVETQFSISKTINGEEGGSINLVRFYFSFRGKLVFVFAHLEIPKNAFSGFKTITLTTDDQFAAINFDPHIVFNTPLNLTLSYTGLDLSQMNLNSTNVGFDYFDDSGNSYPVENEGINVNLFHGSLSVINAKIHHFSRYGFSR